MWVNLSEEERLRFVSAVSGLNVVQIDLSITSVIESRLGAEQRSRYVDYMGAAIADLTYQTVDPSSAIATEAYYFNMLTANADIRARMLWHAINGVQP